ncbi:cardiolipin synthase B [Betaproteobacteria bacterium SCGC AG-212-J23]|nr:cardiolipin synthase B [Betaproteobacteria bacterium SCGC AG-212-J23]
MAYVGGNRLTLLRNGAQYFPALVAAIDAAKIEVFLESYIYAEDETGSLVTDTLARAAARGVHVRLLIDGFGAREFPERWLRALREAGARVLTFRPEFARLRLRRGRLRRMHRKLAAIDGAVGFVGGINVVDDFDGPAERRPRHDYAVRVEGPLASEIRAAAARLWRSVARATVRRGRVLEIPPVPPPAGNQRAALVIRDSWRHRRDIENAYLAHIQSAQRDIVIACAYFFPGRRFRRALGGALARGVRVRLLLQGKIEYALVSYASRALYGSFLDEGIEIHEYQRSVLHAKVAVFDERFASVGSSNIDPLSLLFAREANVFVDDPEFAQQLCRSLEDAMRTGAQQLAPRQWRDQSLFTRLRIWIGYGLARLAISLIGLERYH